jgi:uncharacterized protein (DUF2062 family)
MITFVIFILISFLTPWKVSGSLSIPIAVVIDDPTYRSFISPFNISEYLPSDLPESARLLGIELVRRRVNDLGGIPIQNNTYVLEPTLYNMGYYNGSASSFAQIVVTHILAPMIIIMPIAVVSSIDDMSILMAAECDLSETCIVAPSSSTQALFYCLDTTTPECVNHLGLRRFTSMFSFLPDADYVTSSILGHMANKQQTTVALLSFADGYCPTAAAMTPSIASSYGLTVVYTRGMIPSAACNVSTVVEMADKIRTSGAQVLIIIGAAADDAICAAQLLQYMQSIDYFPNAVAMLGGLDVDVNVVLSLTEDEWMMEYVYGARALDSRTTGPGYTAVSTASHTELFPATANLSSTAVYFNYYQEMFGDAAFSSPYVQYSPFGAGPLIVAFHLLELVGGVRDPSLWMSLAAQQLDAPTSFGTIQFDVSRQNAGLQLQPMVQYVAESISLSPSSMVITTDIVSATSRFQDTVPAPLWSVRLYFTYLTEGDLLQPSYSQIYTPIAAGILFCGIWAGVLTMRGTLKVFNNMFEGRQVLVVRLGAMMGLFGISGSWSFYLFVFQGITFVPVNSELIHASIQVELPVMECCISIACILLLIPAFLVHLYSDRLGRRLAFRRGRNMVGVEGSSQLAGTNMSSIDGRSTHDNTLIDFALRSVHYRNSSVEGDEPVEIHALNKTEPGKEGSGITSAWYSATIARISNVPVKIHLLLILAAGIWCLCPVLIQYIFLQSLNTTSVAASLGSGVWVGYFVLGMFPIYLAMLIGSYVYDNDVLSALLLFTATLAIHLASTFGSSFIYTGKLSSNMFLNQNTAILIAGVISLPSSILAVAMLLWKFDTDVPKLRNTIRQLTRERNRVTRALFVSMQQYEDAKHANKVRTLKERSRAILRMLIDYIRSKPRENAEKTKAYLLKRCHQRFKHLVQQINDVEQVEITSEEVNVFIQKGHTMGNKNTRSIMSSTDLTYGARSTKSLILPTPTSKEVVASPTCTSLEYLLENDLLRDWVEYALAIGMSDEYGQYLSTIRDFEMISDPKAKMEAAQFIRDTFIDPDSHFHVNIQDKLVRSIDNVLSTSSSALDGQLDNIFDEVTREVMLLIKTNDLPLLRRDPVFCDILRRIEDVV